ncbi:MAG: hypothetical protein HZB26_16760 [Candidatus Hydrogenedentes bacterium]|nr:hypothetical protein [Candidatus Hydrogenedentota bacterium]
MFQVLALMLLSQQPIQPVAEGLASYYTVSSSGSMTASGERLKDHEYTCALRNGKFGDYYLVVADNGKSVVCRLNDRGPYIRNRVVDLSQAAMRKLDSRAGMVKVRVYDLGKAIPDFLKPVSSSG